MLLDVVSIYDLKLGAYAQPTVVATTAVAMRSFTDQVNNPQSPMFAHPEDYSLYHIAKFNDETGDFLPISDDGTTVALIVKASDCIQKS